MRGFVVACLAALSCSGCVPSESDIRTDVRQRLNADQSTANLDLSIEVNNRVVFLSGKTTTKEEQEQALAVAKGAEGVKVVVNDMWLNNVALVDRVRQALAADEKVGKIPIEVDAQGTTVRLMSDQTNGEERARAMEIAKAVEGVTQVEDRMR
ncbi:MAG TPA: BON domain-containing protein [Vicinamibacterales bacterium]|nr:BON domain-containing protein [Vicinamibacterales bacterium]